MTSPHAQSPAPIQSTAQSSCVLYVGNLPSSLGDHDFHQLLRDFGPILQSTLVRHKHTGQSAGFGFIHLPSHTQAMAAVRTLDGTVRHGQRLRVYVTREQEAEGTHLGGEKGPQA